MVATETLKQRLVALASRLHRYRTRLTRFWQNRIFCRNQKSFYRSLRLDPNSCHEGIPDCAELLTFWRGIFECDAVASLDGSWLELLMGKFGQDFAADNACSGITSEVVAEAFSRLRNWASHGPDGIQGFWWKRLSSVHGLLCHYFHMFLVGDEALPVWFPVGRTLLLPKKSDVTNPQNFRPITCLNVVYKVWTSCLTSLMLHHCESHQLIHPAQKGCSRGQYGCIDHLLLTNSVCMASGLYQSSMYVCCLD